MQISMPMSLYLAKSSLSICNELCLSSDCVISLFSLESVINYKDQIGCYKIRFTYHHKFKGF